MANAGPEFPISATSEDFEIGPISEGSTLSQVDFLASLSARPGSSAARRMTVTSGRKCSALLSGSGRLPCLGKTLLELSAWNSQVCFLKWKVTRLPSRHNYKVQMIFGPKSTLPGASFNFILLRRISRLSDTLSSRLLFRLSASMPGTSGPESGLLPAMTAQDAHGHEWAQQRNGSKTATLAGAAKLWPTPDACATERDNRSLSPGAANRPTLAKAAKLWPTPTGQDGENNGGPSQYSRNSAPLNVAVKLFPTPTGDDANNVKRASGSFQSLSREVQMFPTPTSGNGENAHGQIPGNFREAMEKIGVSGSLNPDWVEWLMGFPIGHTALKHSATPSFRKSRKSSLKK